MTSGVLWELMDVQTDGMGDMVPPRETQSGHEDVRKVNAGSPEPPPTPPILTTHSVSLYRWNTLLHVMRCVRCQVVCTVCRVLTCTHSSFYILAGLSGGDRLKLQVFMGGVLVIRHI